MKSKKKKIDLELVCQLFAVVLLFAMLIVLNTELNGRTAFETVRDLFSASIFVIIGFTIILAPIAAILHYFDRRRRKRI